MFYVLRYDAVAKPCRWVKSWPFLKGVSFFMGRRIKSELPDPLEFPLHPFVPVDEHGRHFPEYIDGSIPLMRDDLVAALRECGVDNLDVHNAVLLDPDDGSQHPGYKAVNVLGLVKGADLERSVATIHDGIPLIDVDFEELAFRQDLSPEVLMFRLAERTGPIFVAEKLKGCLEARGFAGLAFIRPEESSLF